MSLKRKILNIFAAVVMVFGSMPITFVNTYADSEPGDAPKSLKSVKANLNADGVGDGTYDITLQIEGVSSKKTDATKANVIVVFDTSSSMSETETTYKYTENTSGRYRLSNGDYVQLYRRNSWGNCVRMDNDNSTTRVYTSYDNCRNNVLYTGTRYTRTAQTGTRMDVAKSAVNVLANELLSQNDSSDPNLSDVVEMAFVSFATNASEAKGPTTSLDTFKGWVSATNVSTGADAGTNWESALAAANSVSFDSGDTDTTYIIFVSDGNPTFRDSKWNNNANDCRTDVGFRCPPDPWGPGGSDPNGWNLAAAKAVADLITVEGNNKEFYAVGTFGEANNMKSLGGTYYDATDQVALENAFADIVNKINMGLSVADLQIEDGITTATSAEIKGTAGNFRYNVPESWGDDWGKATFENGSVHWNPGENKTLSNGEVASVTFTVWPSQAAMDCIAKIRNEGTCGKTDEELAAFGLAKNSDGSFRLLTNSSATFKYRTATTIEETGETDLSALSSPVVFEEDRDPTNLPETDLEVTKLWADGMDPGQRDDIKEISLDLYVDRDTNPEPVEHYVFTKEGSEGNAWKNSYTYAVAPGVMKKLDGTDKTHGLRDLGPIVKVGGVEYVVLEPGHDYEFDNEGYQLNGNGTNHYHITKRKYHPMIVDDGGIHDVIFDDSGEFTTAEIDENELTSLSAENTLNGGILVGKKVINNDVEDTEITDKYKITISMQGGDAQTGVYRIFTYNSDGTLKSRSEKINYSNGTITEEIQVNQKIRVQDLPTGTKFTVSEELPNGYDSYDVEYLLIKYDGTEPETGVNEVFGNASSTATVVNTLESGDLKISKEVTAVSGDLEQAQGQVFDFTLKLYEKQGDATAVRTETFSLSHDGVNAPKTKEYKDIPAGWYYEIVEAAKPGFNGGVATTKTGTITARKEEKVDFTNEYRATSATAEVIAHKDFVDGYKQFWINSDSFEFQLIGNNQVIESKNATLSGSTVKFNLSFDNPGTYNYTITEKTKDAEGNSVFRQGVKRQTGDEDIDVEIKVVDDGEGKIKVESIKYSKASQTIYNIYEDTKTYGTNGELEFTKVLEGRDWNSSDEYKLKISGSEGAPMPKTTELTINKDTENHKVNFGTIKYSEKDVDKTYSYTVKEEFSVASVEPKDGVDEITFTVKVTFDKEKGTLGLTVSEHANTFTNVYKTKNVTAAKVWNDGENRDGLRKNYENYYVAVKNDENKFVAYEKLALIDKNDYEFKNLPEKN